MSLLNSKQFDYKKSRLNSISHFLDSILYWKFQSDISKKLTEQLISVADKSSPNFNHSFTQRKTSFKFAPWWSPSCSNVLTSKILKNNPNEYNQVEFWKMCAKSRWTRKEYISSIKFIYPCKISLDENWFSRRKFGVSCFPVFFKIIEQ